MQQPHLLGLSGQKAAATPPAVESTEIFKNSLMVVDDNNRYRGRLQHMIGKVCPQATIYEAENIQVAVHLARQMQPQLIFIDVVLGDEDGIRCARRIKAIAPDSQNNIYQRLPGLGISSLGTGSGSDCFPG